MTALIAKRIKCLRVSSRRFVATGVGADIRLGKYNENLRHSPAYPRSGDHRNRGSWKECLFDNFTSLEFGSDPPFGGSWRDCHFGTPQFALLLMRLVRPRDVVYYEDDRLTGLCESARHGRLPEIGFQENTPALSPSVYRCLRPAVECRWIAIRTKVGTFLSCWPWIATDIDAYRAVSALCTRPAEPAGLTHR